ncbi:uncharacterized protein LOC111304047 [Durio zibethinus]|uniref:Uncharacterized protein LOC111304047 n=1 Tax=Durio zibethinus TaxID=66656 RepID=A0A6P5ZV93_DURZI|nr:uncharacterized protein LOC111304047 [Durio zibethinus]
MASATKSFVRILLLSLVSQGICLCTLNDIIVGTVRTGKEIQGKPEWKVTVTNNCKCTQHELKLACKGFQSVETVDPNILEKQGDNCLVIKGNALKGFTSVSFAYARDPPFLLWPSGSIIEAC